MKVWMEEEAFSPLVRERGEGDSQGEMQGAMDEWLACEGCLTTLSAGSAAAETCSWAPAPPAPPALCSPPLLPCTATLISTPSECTLASWNAAPSNSVLHQVSHC